MKKILFLIDTVDIGGATKLTFDLINYFDPKHFEISVIYLNTPQFPGDNLINYFNFENKSKKLWFKNFRFFKRVLYMYKNFRKYDLVHSCMEQSNFYSSFVKFLPFSDFKLIITFHGLDSVYINDRSVFKPETSKKFIYLIVMKYIQNILFKNVNLFIAVCESIKKYLIEKRNIDENKIQVLYHGLNIKYFNELKSQLEKEKTTRNIKNADMFIIGYIGRLGFSKGLEGFMEIIPGLICTNPKIRITIKGNGELKEYLKAKSDSMSVNEYVKFENFDKDVLNFYNKIDLLVLPSFYETTNLTVLEAMYSKTLVLTSDAGGLPEIIDNNVNGFMFKNGDFDDMAKKIPEIIKLDKSMVEEIKQNAYESVIQKFDLNKNSKMIIKEFRDLIT